MESPPTTSEHEAPRHPIAVVADRTGLSQDVLRVWERRYRAVEPGRSSDGRRLYSDADIGRLRLLYAATNAGRSIGQVAGLPTEELTRIANEDAAARQQRATARDLNEATNERSDETNAVIEQALAIAATLKATELENLLRRSAIRLGLTSFIEDVATPLLRKIGELWHAGRATIAQEHLASSIIHDILAEAMRSTARTAGADTVVVATPAGERHAIGAVLIGAAAAVDGWRVVYLGVDLPANEIAAAAVATEASVVAMSVVYVPDRDHTLDELRALRARLPASVPVVVGGAGATQLAPELAQAGIRVGGRLADLSAVLADAEDAA
ncbi:MAG TPA: cobalamin-dependent protein [Gemmatimonadaceae bacterium]|nr:cobalamin-dependent protein [Gemmatimonadaceae bacterium]